MSQPHPFEINRLAREGEEHEKRLRRSIEGTARWPNEIRTVLNFAYAATPAAEPGKTSLQIIKADGEQLHLQLKADVRRAIIRDLQREETRVQEEENGAGGSGLELPG